MLEISFISYIIYFLFCNYCMVKYRHNSCQNLVLVGIDVARKFIVPLRSSEGNWQAVIDGYSLNCLFVNCQEGMFLVKSSFIFIIQWYE